MGLEVNAFYAGVHLRLRDTIEVMVVQAPIGSRSEILEIGAESARGDAMPDIEGFEPSEEVRRLWERDAFRRRLAGALAAMRGAAGLLQRALATRMGKDAAFVNRMEAFTTPEPKAESVALYAQACGFRAHYLFVPEDEILGAQR